MTYGPPMRCTMVVDIDGEVCTNEATSVFVRPPGAHKNFPGQSHLAYCDECAAFSQVAEANGFHPATDGEVAALEVLKS